MVRQIKDPNTKLTIARKVLEALHDCNIITPNAENIKKVLEQFEKN